ncbi:MAG: HEPN domain-containing protein [Candidatus Caldarchaeum sp.]
MGTWETWFEKARKFIKYAEDDYRLGRYDSASFFAQQSVEMLLNGLLLERTGARPFTHSISEMLNTLSLVYQKDVPHDVLVCASKLERHYAAARYPDTGVVHYNVWDAEEALECMMRIIRYVDELGEHI